MKLTIRYVGTEGYHAFRLVSAGHDDIACTDGANALVEWCIQEIGEPLPLHLRRKGYRPRWVRHESECYDDTFLFRDLADAVAFRLRWC